MRDLIKRAEARLTAPRNDQPLLIDHELIDDMAAALRSMEWMSVEERLPEHGQRCLVGAGEYPESVATFEKGRRYPWADDGHRVLFPTHWMPLPPPPPGEQT